MRVFVVLSAVLVCAFAKPTLLPSVVTYSAPVPSVIGYAATPIAVSSPLSSQYHAQDELGQYSYGYSDGISAKAESKTLDGVTRGGYSYVDAEGKVQHVQYVSDPQNGFRAAATNLPVAPELPLPEGPKPVEDTPEVVKAKSEHLAAVEEAKTRNAAADAADAAEAAEPKTPEPAVGVVPVVHPLPVAYSVPALGLRPVGSYAYSFNTYHHHHAPALAFSPYTYDYLPRPVAYAAFGPAVLPAAHFVHTPAVATEKSESTTEQAEAKSDE